MSNRLLKKELIAAINKIDDDKILTKIGDLIHLKEKKEIKLEPNIHLILELAGTITEEEGNRMKKLIDSEFNNIEGEW